jgi:hypothetical protein
MAYKDVVPIKLKCFWLRGFTSTDPLTMGFPLYYEPVAALTPDNYDRPYAKSWIREVSCSKNLKRNNIYLKTVD